MKGSIVRLQDKGFGFIKPADAGEDAKDVFFHASALVETTFDDLKEGDTVTYDVEEGPKGPAATNVRLASDDTAATTDDAATDEPAEEASEDAPEAE